MDTTKILLLILLSVFVAAAIASFVIHCHWWQYVRSTPLPPDAEGYRRCEWHERCYCGQTRVRAVRVPKGWGSRFLVPAIPETTARRIIPPQGGSGTAPPQGPVA